MSVAVICPYCGTSVTLLRAPVSVCPDCQSAWPEPLRLSAEASLARQKAERPMLLTIGMYVSPGLGGLVLLQLLLAPFNAGSYSINGESVTGVDFLEHAGPFFAVIGASCLAAAYGIWRGRTWSRWAMVAFWVAQVAGAIGFGLAAGSTAEAASAMAGLLLPILVAWWYLFEKENVVEYYRALEKENRAREARVAAARRNGA
jgi:uncharacterized membrane protein YtjA (UPF0391 family)